MNGFHANALKTGQKYRILSNLCDRNKKTSALTGPLYRERLGSAGDLYLLSVGEDDSLSNRSFDTIHYKVGPVSRVHVMA